MHFNSRHRYFSAFATPLCLSASCYPTLSLRAIVLTGKTVSTWKFQSIPFIFAATFNGIIRRKLKSLADTNVVIIAPFSLNSQTVWMGSPQAPTHSKLWYCRISSKTIYSATQNYSTEAVSVISTLRENRAPPVLSPDIAKWHNTTSNIKPFRANTLVLYYQGISGHQPEKILLTYFEYNMRKEKCDFVTVITDFFLILLLFVHRTEPNTAIKPSIVDHLLA